MKYYKQFCQLVTQLAMKLNVDITDEQIIIFAKKIEFKNFMNVYVPDMLKHCTEIEHDTILSDVSNAVNEFTASVAYDLLFKYTIIPQQMLISLFTIKRDILKLK